MSADRDVVVIGGGHNGLITAFYLARAGLKPVVLEARSIVGGMAVTEELCPGFRCPTLAHAGGPIRAEIVRDMALEQHGLRMTQPSVRMTAISPEGEAIAIYDDPAKTAQQLAASSQHDADSFTQFQEVLGRIGNVFRHLAASTPPEIDSPSREDLLRGIATGRMVRRLGRQDMYRLLRWAPMPIADLMDEWFENPLLKATIAARAIFGCSAGPRSPSTSNLLSYAAQMIQTLSALRLSLSAVLEPSRKLWRSSVAAGGTIRTNAEVAGIDVKDGRVKGVHLTTVKRSRRARSFPTPTQFAPCWVC